MQGFRQAQQEYERKLFAPYDELEPEEDMDIEEEIAESMMEEQWLKERGL